jgi:hypothetical protein
MLLSVHFDTSQLSTELISRMCTNTLMPLWYSHFHYTVSAVSGCLGVFLYICIYFSYKNRGQQISPNSSLETDSQSRLTVSLGYIAIIICLMFVVPITIEAVCDWQQTTFSQVVYLGILTRISCTGYIRVHMKRHPDIKSGMGRVIKCETKKDTVQRFDSASTNVTLF